MNFIGTYTTRRIILNQQLRHVYDAYNLSRVIIKDINNIAHVILLPLLLNLIKFHMLC